MDRSANRWMGVVCICFVLWSSSAIASVGQTPPEGPAQPAENNWYIIRNGANYGPYSQTRMAEFVASGVITPNTQVSLAGGDRWVRADAVWPELGGPPTAPLAPGPRPTRVTEEEAFRIAANIQSAKHLAALGVGLWSAGKALQLASFLIVMDAILYSDGVSEAAIWTPLLVGTGLDLFSPIPAVLGERRAQRTLSKTSMGSLSGGKWMIPAAVFYGVGAGLVGAGVAISIAQLTDPSPGWNTNGFYVSFLMIAAGEVGIGFANFSALKRIRRFESRNLSGIALVPSVSNQTMGMSLIGSF